MISCSLIVQNTWLHLSVVLLYIVYILFEASQRDRRGHARVKINRDNSVKCFLCLFDSFYENTTYDALKARHSKRYRISFTAKGYTIFRIVKLICFMVLYQSLTMVGYLQSTFSDRVHEALKRIGRFNFIVIVFETVALPKLNEDPPYTRLKL